jgi:hypothetical protein
MSVKQSGASVTSLDNSFFFPCLVTPTTKTGLRWMMVPNQSLRHAVRLRLVESRPATTATAAAASSFSSSSTTTTTTTASSSPQNNDDDHRREEEEGQQQRPSFRFTTVFNAMDCHDAMRQYSICIEQQLRANNNDYTAVRPRSCQTEFAAILTCYRQTRQQLRQQQQQVVRPTNSTAK